MSETIVISDEEFYILVAHRERLRKLPLATSAWIEHMVSLERKEAAAIQQRVESEQVQLLKEQQDEFANKLKSIATIVMDLSLPRA